MLVVRISVVFSTCVQNVRQHKLPGFSALLSETAIITSILIFRGKGIKLHQERVRLDVRRNFISKNGQVL